MSFDAESFLNQDYVGSNSTEFVAVPIGERTGIINAINAKEIVSQKNGNTYRFLEVDYIIDDDEAREATGMAEPRARQSMILDIADDGTIDRRKGKNVSLGKLRDACDLNDPKQQFNFNMLIGKAVKCNIKHRIDDNGQTWAEVKGVAKL